MPAIYASCHCGNLHATLTTDKAAREIAVRACQCGFCRRHQMRSLSDPQGTLAIRVRDADLLNRYRFGLKTADFLICRECGNYIGALLDEGDRAWGIMNANLIEGGGPHFGEGRSVDYDTEGAEERSARRRRVWTPASVFVGRP